MVHLRLNDGDTARNEFINFVSALDGHADKDDALRRLHQLAAIYKPIMKRHGLRINHLQEYEPNPEFAGRNWNAGENIEMVLRDHSGLFLPFGLICSVFAHELAHNFQMNHSAKHTKLTRELNQERLELQRNGYYGDGFWSAGKRLDDASWVAGESSVTNAQLPSNLCGGAWKRRGASNKRRQKRRGGDGTTKRRKKGVPSLRTGAQTGANIERVAGNSRRYLDLPGQGSRVDGNNTIPTASAKSESYKEDPNSTFRKRANTNAARDARAAAAMKRMAALKSEQDGGVKPEQGSSVKAEGSKVDKKPFDDGFESDGDAGSCTESESGSETQSESETEDELIYDSSDETVPGGGKCGTSSAAPSASASTATTQDPSSSSSAPTPRAETDVQRKRRMEQFRRSDGGRNERQARDEWRDIVKQTQSMRIGKGAGAAAAVTAKGKEKQPQASTTSSKASTSKRVEHSDTEDDDDEIVFVSSTKKPKQE